MDFKGERVAALYREGKINDAGLARAVVLKWLTQAEADAVKAEVSQ